MAVMLTSFLMRLGRRVAARGICLSSKIGQILRTFTISHTTSATGVHLGFERDFNYHTAYRGRVTSSSIRSIRNSLGQLKLNQRTETGVAARSDKV